MRTKHGHDVLEVHVAQHVIGLTVDEGIARVLMGERDHQVVVPGTSGVEHHDVAPEHHDVPSNPIGVIEQAIDDSPGARFQRNALEKEPQFLWRM